MVKGLPVSNVTMPLSTKFRYQPLVGAVAREIGHETMAQVLVRIGALHVVIELVHRQIDERGEIPVVNRVGIRVVGGQAEVLSDPLDSRYVQAVVNGIGHVIVIVHQSGADCLQAGIERARKPWTQAGQCARAKRGRTRASGD